MQCQIKVTFSYSHVTRWILHPTPGVCEAVNLVAETLCRTFWRALTDMADRSEFHVLPYCRGIGVLRVR